ncbi:MAG: hypothetical protein JW808_04630 [Victivallales bacterium]|nr:hypothetical protein [Victivallales bacterium]
MSESKFKNRLGSWAASAMANVALGFIGNLRRSLIDFLEQVPEGAGRMLYAIFLLVFLATLSAAGVVILPASVIVIMVRHFGPGVDKTLVAAQFFFFFGLFLLVFSTVIICMVARGIKTSTEKVTRRIIRRIEK